MLPLYIVLQDGPARVYFVPLGDALLIHMSRNDPEDAVQLVQFLKTGKFNIQ